MLVVAPVSLKLRKTKRGEERQQRFDTAKLKNSNTEKAFKLELKNRFHILQEKQEMNIDSFNQVLTETSKSLQGYRKKRKEEWIKTHTWKTIDERKETKKKINDTKSQRINNKTLFQATAHIGKNIQVQHCKACKQIVSHAS